MGGLAEAIRGSVTTGVRELQVEHASQMAAKHATATEEGVPPWKCMSEKFSILEPELRERILSLSDTEWTWTEAVVRTENFDLQAHVGTAKAVLEEDRRLAELRLRLVPSKMTEETFWKRYFVAVSGIKHSLLVDYGKANQEHRKTREADASQDEILAELERELQSELQGFEDSDELCSPSADLSLSAELSAALGNDDEEDDMHL